MKEKMKRKMKKKKKDSFDSDFGCKTSNDISCKIDEIRLKKHLVMILV